MDTIPILVMAYCRPVEFRRLSLEIENLPKRSVTISIDGPTSDLDSLTFEVSQIAKLWKSSSKHEISIIESDANLGLFDHFYKALNTFFTTNKFGLILEDDMEIRPEFVEFLDSPLGKISVDNYWSICGYNPISQNPTHQNVFISKIEFFESEVHTIWGWASNSDSVKYFLEFARRYRNNSDYLNEIATKFVQRACKDPIFRWALKKNWHRKIARATTIERPNWDNFWVLSGWASGKKSLLPSISLSRENPEVFGRQTHKRVTSGKEWNSQVFTNVITIVQPVKLSRRRDQKLLSVWGSSRVISYKYALSFFLKILS